jgi:hypothetical protein
MLGDGILFDNHTSALTESQAELDANHPHISRRPRPDQLRIHRVGGSTNSLLLALNISHRINFPWRRSGREYDRWKLWEGMVKCNTVPTIPMEKLRYEWIVQFRLSNLTIA